MSAFLGQFSGTEVLRLFLHGLSAVYPIVLFPSLLAGRDISILLIPIVVAGLILYATPIDFLISEYRNRYNGLAVCVKRNVKNHITDEEARMVYEILFFEKLDNKLRARAEWLTSLYYFYSRTFTVSILQFLFFTVGALYLVVYLTFPSCCPKWAIVTNEAPEFLLLKSAVVIGLSSCVGALSYRYSKKTVRDVYVLETALIRYYTDELNEIALKVSGMQLAPIPRRESRIRVRSLIEAGFRRVVRPLRLH